MGMMGMLANPLIAEAAEICGPGDDWVDSCTAGVDAFPSSIAYLDLWLYNPDSSMEKVILTLNGPVTITRDDPVDALIGDADLGNVGVLDGNNGVIKTKLEEEFIGDKITLTGIGVGAIVEATELGINRPDLADSFFEVFAEIVTPDGKARNMNPVKVYANRWLTGVPPTSVSPVAPGGGNPLFPTRPVSWDQEKCDANNPTAPIIYCGFDETDFFAIDDDGEFILDGGGNKILVATLHSEAHGVVPEPLTILGSVTAFGFGTFFKRKLRQNNKA